MISLVVIIWMLMPGLGQRLEHRGGDAGVGPHPQADDRDLGDLGVVRDARRPDRLRGRPRRRASVSARSPAATVKLTSVVPVGRDVLDDHVDDDVRRGDRAEDRVDHARPVGDAQDRDPRLVLGQRRAGDASRPAAGRRSRRRSRCPGASENELRTWIGTSYFLANSIERECITPAPRLASSSISS